MCKSQAKYTENLYQICVCLTYNVYVLAPHLYSVNAVQQTPQSTVLPEKLLVTQTWNSPPFIKPYDSKLLTSEPLGSILAPFQLLKFKFTASYHLPLSPSSGLVPSNHRWFCSIHSSFSPTTELCVNHLIPIQLITTRKRCPMSERE